jgi:hypothetical protein
MMKNLPGALGLSPNSPICPHRLRDGIRAGNAMLLFSAIGYSKPQLICC